MSVAPENTRQPVNASPVAERPAHTAPGAGTATSSQAPATPASQQESASDKPNLPTQFANTATGWGEGIRDWLKDFTKDLGLAEAGGVGIVAAGLYVIGNMFFNGGLFGTICGGLLMTLAFTSDIGKDLGNQLFGDGTRNQRADAAGRERRTEVGQAPVQEREQGPAAASEQVYAQAREAVSGANMYTPPEAASTAPLRAAAGRQPLR